MDKILDLSVKVHIASELVRKLSLALVTLIPGGSEWFSYSKELDLYYADTKACEEYVRKRYASGHESKIKVIDLERENRELRQALEDITKMPKVDVDTATNNPVLFSYYNQVFKIAKKALG